VNVRNFVAVLRRNPLVSLGLIVLTLLTAVGVMTIPPAYQARTVVTFLAPPTSLPRNSYASFTPDLTVMAEVAARDMAGPPSRAAVRRAGGTADYEVVLANRGNEELPIHDQPYVTVLTSSRDPAAAQRTLQAVLGVLRANLTARQTRVGASAGSLVSWKLTAVTNQPVPQSGRPTRTLAAIAVLGVLGTVYGTLLADRRRSRPARARLSSRRGGLDPMDPRAPEAPA
jgi:hypothetical protein